MGYFDEKGKKATDGLAAESAKEIEEQNKAASEKLEKLGLKNEAGEPEEEKPEDKPVTAQGAPSAPRGEAKPEAKADDKK